MKLSSQAKKILEQLKQHNEMTVEDLEKEGFDQSMVNRAALELEEKGLAEMEEDEIISYEITDAGDKIIEQGSPEYRLVERVKEGEEKLSDLQNLDLDIALGKAREKGWVEIEDGKVYLTERGENAEDEVRENLREEDFGEEEKERRLVSVNSTTRKELLITEKGSETVLGEVEEEFNVEARTKTPRTGKKHFYKEILDFARSKWLEMGFKEMSGDFVVSSLLNFDALYTPQDHPARELHDTFFLETPETADLSEYDEKVDHIKQTHQNGWTTGSKGWNYDWSEKEAARNVLRTHTTAVSARKLHEIDINEEELPKKYFLVGRNFRNETVDRHHLPGFIQTDGIVVGKDLNYRHLKGYIQEFFSKMGYDEIRFIPAYYPYTEMSMEIQGYDEEEQEWIGLGGSGMLRPEVVKPLLGFEARVLAWGLGLPRIAMGSAGLKDIRDLYRNDLKILEETPVWRPDEGGE